MGEGKLNRVPARPDETEELPLTRLPVEVDALLGVASDLEERLAAVAALLTPCLADACIIHEVKESEALVPIGFAHRDAAAAPLVARLAATGLQGLPPALTLSLTTGEPRLLDEAGPAFLRAARGEPMPALVEELRLGQAYLVPLVAARGIVGSLLLLNTGLRTLGAAEKEAADRIGRRIALSLDYVRAIDDGSAGTAAKRSFLALMGHELKTPINIILGYSDLLTRGVPEALPDRAVRQVERLRASAQHLLGLVEEVLTLARLEAGTERVLPEGLDLRTIVIEAIAIAEDLAPDRSLRLEPRLPSRAVRVRSDRVKVRQILLELLTNAIKFTPAGTITVELRAGRGNTVVTVQDTGTGMAPDELERAFDPFWQSDLSATRRVQGTGLGLTIAAGLARLLGGELTIESSKGEGTRARLTLPRASAEQGTP